MMRFLWFKICLMLVQSSSHKDTKILIMYNIIVHVWISFLFLVLHTFSQTNSKSDDKSMTDIYRYIQTELKILIKLIHFYFKSCLVQTYINKSMMFHTPNLTPFGTAAVRHTSEGGIPSPPHPPWAHWLLILLVCVILGHGCEEDLFWKTIIRWEGDIHKSE